MFTIQERSRIRGELIAFAQSDGDVDGAALVGSFARGQEDRWSDVDLVLRLSEEADEPTVVERWTRRIKDEYGAADSLDMYSAAIRYRLFLLPSSLQVDVGFSPPDLFGAMGEGFRLVFGCANEPAAEPTAKVGRTIGKGWLDALHVRSALARGKPWQALILLDDLRNRVGTLACLRLGLNPWQGRDVDRLPADLRKALLETRPPDLTADALDLSRRLLVELFLAEVERHDPTRAAALREPVGNA